MSTYLKTFDEFARNKDWLASVKKKASELITAGIPPQTLAYITHYPIRDQRHLTAVESVLVSSKVKFKPLHGLEVLNNDDLSLQNIVDYNPEFKAPIDNSTKHQIAAVMLLHGNEKQQAEATSFLNAAPKKFNDFIKFSGFQTLMNPKEAEYVWLIKFIAKYRQEILVDWDYGFSNGNALLHDLEEQLKVILEVTELPIVD